MDITKVMQIADTFMVSIGRNLRHPGNLIAKGLERVGKIMFLPILHQGSI